MEYEKLPAIGPATPEEKEFSSYLSNKIADYIEKIPTDRRVLIAGLCRVCQIVFCHQTPLNVKLQCKEIDDFCAFLKSHARKEI
jgi:hypothetical protein